MMLPTFRNEIEAAIHAERHKPLQTALDIPNGPEYANHYGKRAAFAAENCRLTAKAGAMHSLCIHARSLSTILFHERPDLFETRERRAA